MGAGKLTVAAIKAAKPGKLYDAGGLFLDVRDNGARYWRMKYRHGGKERLLAFGVYPEVTLAEARQRRDAARATLRDGRDPSAERKAGEARAVHAAANTFGAVAKIGRQCHSRCSPDSTDSATTQSPL